MDQIQRLTESFEEEKNNSTKLRDDKIAEYDQLIICRIYVRFLYSSFSFWNQDFMNFIKIRLEKTVEKLYGDKADIISVIKKNETKIHESKIADLEEEVRLLQEALSSLGISNTDMIKIIDYNNRPISYQKKK